MENRASLYLSKRLNEGDTVYGVESLDGTSLVRNIRPMVEGDFTVSCTQCGGQDFQQVYPVPAVVYRVYDGSEGHSREVSPEVYACLQCGHVEHFISLEGAGGLNADAQTPRDHFDARG